MYSIYCIYFVIILFCFSVFLSLFDFLRMSDQLACPSFEGSCLGNFMIPSVADPHPVYCKCFGSSWTYNLSCPILFWVNFGEGVIRR